MLDLGQGNVFHGAGNGSYYVTVLLLPHYPNKVLQCLLSVKMNHLYFLGMIAVFHLIIGLMFSGCFCHFHVGSLLLNFL
ncbi:hypothetical protein Leryth_006810 [Lithospermum erythrorhizon]|nr:hypothetical protein Leryth_006810 [Lithospermum erythrorhizon]